MLNKTKRTIFESAVKSFSTTGYNGTSMDEIAEHAGVAKGTLYYHFKSKEEIFNFIVDEGVCLLIDQLEEDIKGAKDALEKLEITCRTQLAIFYKNKDFFKLLMSQLWGQELRQIELRSRLSVYIQKIKSFMDEAMEHHLIRKGNAEFMAFAFFGTLCSSAVYEIIKADHVDVDTVVNELIAYTMSGLK